MVPEQRTAYGGVDADRGHDPTRRPELRAYFDATGARFRDQLTALVTAMGSTDPARHALSLVAWADGLMFSCVAGSFGAQVPSRGEVRAGLRELLDGMLGSCKHEVGPGKLIHDAYMTTQRSEPAPNADERTMLEGWLDYHRQTLAWKCEGLTDAQLRTASVEPSRLSLMGLVRHMAEVERSWFRRVLADEDAGPIYYSDEDPDGEFHLTEADTWAEAYATWQAEIEAARPHAARFGLDDISEGRHRRTGERFNLRWIYTHMIEEYARHNGHADLVRERIDGATGD